MMNGLETCDSCKKKVFWSQLHKILRHETPRYLCDDCYKAYMDEQRSLWDLHLAPFRGYW